MHLSYENKIPILWLFNLKSLIQHLSRETILLEENLQEIASKSLYIERSTWRRKVKPFYFQDIYTNNVLTFYAPSYLAMGCSRWTWCHVH